MGGSNLRNFSKTNLKNLREKVIAFSKDNARLFIPTAVISVLIIIPITFFLLRLHGRGHFAVVYLFGATPVVKSSATIYDNENLSGLEQVVVTSAGPGLLLAHVIMLLLVGLAHRESN
ncbi:MAG: hypothetical protein ACFFB3_03610 [Candidatus Hodarchaeota archaeon]